MGAAHAHFVRQRLHGKIAAVARFHLGDDGVEPGIGGFTVNFGQHTLLLGRKGQLAQIVHQLIAQARHGEVIVRGEECLQHGFAQGVAAGHIGNLRHGIVFVQPAFRQDGAAPGAVEANPGVIPGILVVRLIVGNRAAAQVKQLPGEHLKPPPRRCDIAAPAEHEMDQVVVADGRAVAIAWRCDVHAKLHQAQGHGIGGPGVMHIGMNVVPAPCVEHGGKQQAQHGMADARRKPSAHIHFLLSIGLFFLTAMDMCAIVTVEFHALLGEGIRLPLAKARQTVYDKRGIRAFSSCGAMVSLIFGAIFPIRRFSRGRTGARCSFPSATRPCAHNAKWG